MLASSGAAAAQSPPDSVTLVHAGRLLDRPGQRPRGQSTIVVRNGKVEAVRDGFIAAAAYPGATQIDLKNQFVLPGLIDSHVHLDSDKAGQAGLIESLTNSDAYVAYEAAVNARKTLEAGFTSVRNLGDSSGATLA
ncbi:MAG: amidohydrolase family protein, partial [Steroidobacteraceae bacterium]